MATTRLQPDLDIAKKSSLGAAMKFTSEASEALWKRETKENL